METTLKSAHHLPAETREYWKLSGIVTGQIAGLVMAALMMLVFGVFLGESPLYPVQLVGSALMGDAAMVGMNWGAVFVGIVVHLAGPSLFWGFIYGFAASGLIIKTHMEALWLGLALGVAAMVGPYLIIPALMVGLHGVDYWNREVPQLWDWLAHLVFGASFVIYPSVQRMIGQASD